MALDYTQKYKSLFTKEENIEYVCGCWGLPFPFKFQSNQNHTFSTYLSYRFYTEERIRPKGKGRF